jgi:hypothetical protein
MCSTVVQVYRNGRGIHATIACTDVQGYRIIIGIQGIGVVQV